MLRVEKGYGAKRLMAEFPRRNWSLAAGMIPVEFLGDLWHQKTRVPLLSCGVVCVMLRLAVLVEHRLVTDGRTNGQTQRHG